jgi:hypothetical protein
MFVWINVFMFVWINVFMFVWINVFVLLLKLICQIFNQYCCK